MRSTGPPPDEGTIADASPFGEDWQLGLYLCYELHYRGFADVDAAREWDPDLLKARAALERPFLQALRHQATRHERAAEALDDLLVEPVDGTGVTHYLQDDDELWQLREYAAQRSLYHLKEADPHAWVLPRLWGRAKAGMAAVDFDEFGGGLADRVHARLFSDLMADLGLDTTYGRYLDSAGAEALAVVNLMSLFGLHRALRGALAGHFATVEITSSPGSRRLAQAMRRTGAGPAAEHFYGEHVEADAVHEQVVRREVVAGLLEEEPHLDSDVAFGVDATNYVEDRLAEQLLGAWRAGESSLRTPVCRICRDAPALLRPGGVLLLVRSALSGAEETLRLLRAAGLNADVVEHRYIAVGPVLRSRRSWLRSRGLLEGNDGKEELVIIRAERLL